MSYEEERQRYLSGEVSRESFLRYVGNAERSRRRAVSRRIDWAVVVTVVLLLVGLGAGSVVWLQR